MPDNGAQLRRLPGDVSEALAAGGGVPDGALIGKWHLKSDPTGFDHWEILPGQGHYYNAGLPQCRGGKRTVPGYVTDLITDNWLGWSGCASATRIVPSC